jgi:hypothetical protein
MSTELPVPNSFWGFLSQEDRTEYLLLRNSFHHGQKISSKDRRVVTFRRELTIVLQYLERSTDNLEARSIVTGLCFAGRAVCVNTRQLKSFLKRCKSSINGSFQQLGYLALRTKSKARTCVLAVLPSLQNEPNILRQWTVRVMSDHTDFCFVSSFSMVVLPEITKEDLLEDHPLEFETVQPASAQPARRVTFAGPPPRIPQPILQMRQRPHPLKPTILDDDLPSFMGPSAQPSRAQAPVASSVSVDCLGFEWDVTAPPPPAGDDPWKPPSSLVMKKSQSLCYETVLDDWDFFGQGF